MMVKRTTVMVAQRLSTVWSADVICWVSKGVVAEHGSHNDPRGLNGIYASLCKLQSVGEGTGEIKTEQTAGTEQKAIVVSTNNLTQQSGSSVFLRVLGLFDEEILVMADYRLHFCHCVRSCFSHLRVFVCLEYYHHT